MDLNAINEGIDLDSIIAEDFSVPSSTSLVTNRSYFPPPESETEALQLLQQFANTFVEDTVEDGVGLLFQPFFAKTTGQDKPNLHSFLGALKLMKKSSRFSYIKTV